ncbi:rhamnan synthesis F family protein [Qipengyuania sp. CAU 1752]
MRRACFFVSYWHEPRLAEHIHYHLEALAALGFEIFFASNSPLDATARDRLTQNCVEVVERPNHGYDFGAWRELIDRVDLSPYDGLLLTNSSIIGPLFDLRPMFEAMAARECDFWGMTLNRLHRTHIQSYFLYFHPAAWRSQAWVQFWSGVENLSDKEEVIWRYELMFSQTLEAAGLKGSTYIAPNPWWSMGLPSLIPGRRGKPVYLDDPTIARAAAIIREGMPYVKASFLHIDAKNGSRGFTRLRALLETDRRDLFERLARPLLLSVPNAADRPNRVV